MALPTSRAELKAYIRRTLGEPVITVNVADSQMDDRISDALSLFQDYHYDATQTVYLKHVLTPSTLVMSGLTGTFANNEQVVGSTSNTVGLVFTQANTTSLQFTYDKQVDLNAGFTVGETITGTQSGATAVVGTITKGDVDNEYLPVSSEVLNVTKLLTLGGFGMQGGTGMFSFQYQYLLNDMSMLAGGGLQQYYMTRSHLEMLQDLLVGDVNLRFVRHAHRLYLDIDWHLDVAPGQYLVFEAVAKVDPEEFHDVWSNRYLIDYATALVKRQWGQNLLKYQGAQMPGGVTLNGQAIYDEGNREATELKQTIRDQFELPPNFIVA